jgi:branched-chain amino acid transport system ATP-binding protein
MEKIVEVQGVYKLFGEFTALSNVSFFLKEGEKLGLIGPNGAGKTTLINVISGYYKPSRGRVFYLGDDVTNCDAHERVKRGLVRTFQISSVFGNLKVIENVALALTYSRRSVKWRFFGNLLDPSVLELSYKILEGAGLEKNANIKCSELAHGDRRKLEVAMAKALKPKVLLLDEPFAGLSDLEIDFLKEDIANFLKESGCSLLIVDHKITKLIDFVDRLLCLHEGKILCEGKPHEVVEMDTVRKVYWKL